MAVDTKRMDEASIWWARECPATADLLGTAAVELDTLRARVRELEAALERHGRQGEAAIEAVVAMDAEASHD